MWIKISENRFKKRILYSKYSLIFPLKTFGISFGVISLILTIPLNKGYYMPAYIQSFESYFEIFPYLLLFSFFLSFLTLIYRIKSKYLDNDYNMKQVVRCNKCFNNKIEIPHIECECGGKYEISDYFEWIKGNDLKIYKKNPDKYEEYKVGKMKIPFLIKFFKIDS